MKNISIYFDSWASKWGSDGSKLDLALLDINGLTCVNLAFAQPDCSYKSGQKTWDGTGLNFSQDFSVVYDAIKILQGRGITVMLSVGGGSYSNWTGFNSMAIKDLAIDLGVCGIDVDWEDGSGKTKLIDIMKEVWTPKYLSFAGFSTGAFEPSEGDQWRGSAIDTLKWGGFNWVNIMAYDAGPGFDVSGAYDSYRVLWSGDLVLGFEVGAPGWGGYMLTSGDVVSGVDHVKNDLNGGVFVWSWGSDSTGTPSLIDICNMAHAAFMIQVTAPVVVADVPAVIQPTPTVVAVEPVVAAPSCPCHDGCHAQCPRTWCHKH